jgi:hypothetical protein
MQIQRSESNRATKAIINVYSYFFASLVITMRLERNNWSIKSQKGKITLRFKL